MVKIKIIKVLEPILLLGIDVTTVEKVSGICQDLQNNSQILPCRDAIPNMVCFTMHGGKLKRFRITSEVIPGATFKGLLIDFGEMIEVNRRSLFNIPLNVLNFDPAAKLIKVPGLRASGMGVVEEGPRVNVKLKETNHWTSASHKFVIRLFEDNSVVNVTYLKEISGDKVHGSVYVTYRNERANLRDLLVKEKYAFEIEEVATPVVHNISEDTLSTKIESDRESTGSTESLSHQSISKLLTETRTNRQTLYSLRSNTGPVDSTSSSMAPASSRPLNNTSLTTLSLDVVENQVKTWFVCRSDKENIFQYKPFIKPILSWDNSSLLHTFIKETFRKYDGKVLMLIQTYMIPAIIRGYNVVAIASLRKGKTMGFIIPILQRIATDPFSRTRKFNPLAVIISTSWKRVRETHDRANRFIELIQESSGLRRPKIVSAHAGCDEQANIEILNVCDVLITTPRQLLRMLKTHEFFKLNEMKIFCMDDAENLIAEHLEVMREIMLYKRTGAIDQGLEPQKIVTATKWTSGLESFVRNEMGDEFSIIINNPEEIVVINRLNQIIVDDCTSMLDIYHRLIKYLELTQATMNRTIIFASDDNEIMNIHKFLGHRVNYELKLMLGGLTSNELREIERDWNTYRGIVKLPILLISDEALGRSEISIYNAHTLLHVGIREESFGRRLNFLRDKFSEFPFLPSSQGEEKEPKICHSYLFLLEKELDLSNAYFLYTFLGRCNCRRPAWLHEKALDFLLSREKSKGVDDICVRLKSFGECNKPACNNRHIIQQELDKPQLPNKGHIKFRLLHFDNPGHFFIRVLEHQTDSSERFKCDYMTLRMNLSNYFNCRGNVSGINSRDVRPGLVAAYQAKDLLERVKVLKTKAKKPGHIKVKMIDLGSEMDIEQAELLQLPKELREFPPQAIEVYVTKMRPLDLDDFYGEDACKFAKTLLENNDLHAIVLLCIGSTIWLDTVTQLVFHPLTNVAVYDNNIVTEMIHNKFAVFNASHVDKLVRFCGGKIDIWTPSKQPAIDDFESAGSVPLTRKFTYRNLPITFEALSVSEDLDDTEDCFLTDIISPQMIIVHKADKLSGLRQLEEEIQIMVNYIHDVDVRDVPAGSRVLFYKESKWQRGFILSVSEGITIFSLDWGTVDKFIPIDCRLKMLPSEYQSAYPYQAICCSLAYCKFVSTMADKSTIVDGIRNFCSDPTRSVCLKISAGNAEKATQSAFGDYLSHATELDITQAVTVYSVTIGKSVNYGISDDMLHEFLLRNQLCLPTVDWVVMVLPECTAHVSKMERNGSVPHIVHDILTTGNDENREKFVKKMEDIIRKKCDYAKGFGTISSSIDGMINSLIILLHFVYNSTQSVYVHLAFNHIVDLADQQNVIIDGKENETILTIKYVMDIMFSYQSITFHLLRHLNAATRRDNIGHITTMLDTIQKLMNSNEFLIDVYNDENWFLIMANCVGFLKDYESTFILLIDIIERLFMNYDQRIHSQSNLAGILRETCVVFEKSESPAIWKSCLCLISCIVNSKEFNSYFRQFKVFESIFDKFIRFYDESGSWTEFHNMSLDIIIDMWRNGSANRIQIVRSRKLSEQLLPIAKENSQNVVLNKLLTDILTEESAVVKSTGSAANDGTITDSNIFLPDADAVAWSSGIDLHMRKKQIKSSARLFGDQDSMSHSDNSSNELSDSDSSNIGVTPFADREVNPADEDNVLCYDLP